MTLRAVQTVSLLLIMTAVAGAAPAVAPDTPWARTARQLAAADAVSVELSPVSGAARSLRAAPGVLAVAGDSLDERARAALELYGKAFGTVEPSAELVAGRVTGDKLGASHHAFRQVHRGVPVFGAELRVHLDAGGELTGITGNLVPGIALDDVQPVIPVDDAAAIARTWLAKQDARAGLGADGGRLLVYRDGLPWGRPGDDLLVWEVEVTSGDALVAWVYVDAHVGAVVERIDAPSDIFRVLHESRLGNIIWREGDELPYSGSGFTADEEINGLISATADVYDFFANLSDGQWLSWNGSDRPMSVVYADENLSCPNAQWTGSYTRFCAGVASDDVAAHEWAHAYTQASHGLIYLWQSGALNEAYSDIFGEAVDLVNGAGTDEPSSVRTSGACSAFSGEQPPRLVVIEPASVAGEYPVGGAEFNPMPPWTLEAQLELVDDGEGTATDACEPLVDFTPGRIAVVDLGRCLFRTPAENVEAAGAAGMIMVNSGSDALIDMVGAGNRLSIPSVFIGRTAGEAVKAEIGAGVRARMSSVSENSVRWLMGEDSWAFGGAIRDMWEPGCLGDPGRVSDTTYWCSQEDNGGVHTNSGVPNHAFALLVDGGTSGGVTVGALGLTKAVHIYWRAMTVYQTPISDFGEHADLLETSCADLTGIDLTDPRTGGPSGEVLTVADCAEVANAMDAVEMREPPTQCGFTPVLAPGAPALLREVVLLEETFDAGPPASWALSHEGEANVGDWEWSEDLPDGAAGGAFHAPEGPRLSNCGQVGGVKRLDTPTVTVPAAVSPVLSFDHWVATEDGFDGGNLSLSVNGGPFEPIPADAFLYNPYNRTLVEAPENESPLAGQPAFSGTDEGSFHGSWGQSQVDLGGLIEPGDVLQIRFEFGTDSCVGHTGWYVDNVRVAAASTVRRAGDRRSP